MSLLRTLVTAQLRLDLRNPKTGRASASRAVLTVVSYGFSGALLAVVLWAQGAPLDAIAFAGTSFAMVMAAFSVAGTYDELMGRPKEHAWALTLPVSERTHYWARVINIALFSAVTNAMVALPMGLVAGATDGAGAALQVGAVTLLAATWTTAAGLGALWALTLALPYRRLKPLLTLVRAVLVGAIVLGYQMIGMQALAVPEAAWWPALWFTAPSAPTAALLAGSFLALLGLFGAYFPRRYFALMGRLRDSEAAASRPSGAAPSALERPFVRAGEARAAFGLTVAALRSDRLVRGRVWPSALLVAGFAAFGVWRDGLGSFFVYNGFEALVSPMLGMHLSVLTVLLFAAQACAQAAQITDHPEAAWIYGALPVRRARALQLGVQQAIAFRVLLPLHLVLFGLLTWTMPLAHAALHAAFWYGAAVLVTRLHALFYSRAPFSRGSDRFSLASRFLPLVLSVPAAVCLILLQAVGFASGLSAVLTVVGLGVLNAGLVQVVQLRPLPPRAVAPAPAPSPAVR